MNYWEALQNDEDRAMLEQGDVALQRTALEQHDDGRSGRGGAV